MIGCLTAEELGDLPQLSEGDIIVLVRQFQLFDLMFISVSAVQITTFDYGKKAENPIDRMRFYAKQTPEKANRVLKEQVHTFYSHNFAQILFQVSQMLPPTFMEQQIRVFCRKDDSKSLDAAWR